MKERMDKIIIYGANGYSAQLIIERLVQFGYKPVLAGRNAEAVKIVAEKFNCTYKVFGLSESKMVNNSIEEFDFLLNCAGPFKDTAPQLIDACIKSKTNYLDITGEIPVIEYAWAKNDEAKSAGIILAPSVGFDVIPTDCLAFSLSEKMHDAINLELALLNKNGKISRGTFLTTLEMLKDKGKVRRNKKILDSDIGEFHLSFYKSGFRFNGISIPWGDVASAFYSTGIPNITVYLGIPYFIFKNSWIVKIFYRLINMRLFNKLFSTIIRRNITGPTLEERNNGKTFLWGRVTDSSGKEIENCYQVMEGYNATQKGASEILQKLISCDFEKGTRTPSMIMGSEYFKEFIVRKIF